MKGYLPNFIYGFIESTVALISGILTIEAIYDKQELEEMSHAHVVVAKIKKVEGDKMELGMVFGSIFWGILMTGLVACACVAFVVHVVSKL